MIHLMISFVVCSSEGGSVKTDVLFSTSLGALSCSPRLTCRQLN